MLSSLHKIQAELPLEFWVRSKEIAIKRRKTLDNVAKVNIFAAFAKYQNVMDLEDLWAEYGKEVRKLFRTGNLHSQIVLLSGVASCKHFEKDRSLWNYLESGI